MTEPTFQTLGRYTIRAEIGRGGFATVYQALDASLNREVALKVLHPQMSADRTFVERFRKEARTLAGLRHPHIVTVYEVSEVEGRLFIAMELAHGSSLAQAIVDRKRFPWTDTLAILKPVSEALDYAHGQGVVHRDLKPANVLLDAERGPLLTDFGFARLLGDNSASMSLSGGILGTPAYIAPEVWELDTATPAADIYALGCIVYEMLTGDVLFVGKTPMQSMRAHDRGPQFPATWPEDVPPGVAAALQVALARQPETRYPKATTFWHALNDLEANAQVTREQAERQAVANQWKAEVAAAMAASEWSAAKMAVGRWLSITPDDPQAQAARKEIDRQIEQQAKQKDEAERTAQAVLALAAARKAEEERARQEAERKAQAEADRKAKEEQERQRQTELAAQAAAAEKATQEAAERERHKQAREAAKLAEEEARRKELTATQQPVVIKPVQRPQTETSRKATTAPALQGKSNRTWLYITGGVITVIAIVIVLASINPAPTPAPTQIPAPTMAPTATAAPAKPANSPVPVDTPTVKPADTPTVISFQGIAKTAPDCSYGGLMKSIEALDASTVKFTLCASDVAFPAKIAFATLGIQSAKHLQETSGKPLESALGTGPYMVKEWLRGDHLTLVANPNYWGDPPKTRSIVFRWNADSAARLNSLGSEVDGIDNPDPGSFDRIQADSFLKLYPREALNVFFLGMNNTKPPFDNEKVRQAIAMGINRQAIIDKYYPPGSSVADYFTPCIVPGGCEGDPWYPFDPQTAKALLAEAGFPNGFQTTLSYRDVVRSYLPAAGKVAEEIQTQLKENLGIDATLNVQQSADFLRNALQGNFPLYLFGWGVDYPDQTDFLDQLFGKGANAQFGNKFDDLTTVLSQAASVADLVERNKLYAQANNLIRQHVPMVPIAHSGSATVWKAAVDGVHSSPLGDERFEFMSIPSVPSQDTLVWMQAAEPLSLYCSDETDSESFRACEQIFDPLLSYESSGTTIQSGLATECTPNNGLTEWICKLRQGARFSDGTPVTANDVVETYAVQWDAADPLHTGNSGNFDYWPAFFNGFLNPKK